MEVDNKMTYTAVGGLIGAVGLGYFMGPLAGVVGAIIGGLGGNIIPEMLAKSNREFIDPGRVVTAGSRAPLSNSSEVSASLTEQKKLEIKLLAGKQVDTTALQALQNATATTLKSAEVNGQEAAKEDPAIAAANDQLKQKKKSFTDKYRDRLTAELAAKGQPGAAQQLDEMPISEIVNLADSNLRKDLDARREEIGGGRFGEDTGYRKHWTFDAGRGFLMLASFGTVQPGSFARSKIDQAVLAYDEGRFETVKEISESMRWHQNGAEKLLVPEATRNYTQKVIELADVIKAREGFETDRKDLTDQAATVNKLIFDKSTQIQAEKEKAAKAGVTPGSGSGPVVPTGTGQAPGGNLQPGQ